MAAVDEENQQQHQQQQTQPSISRLAQAQDLPEMTTSEQRAKYLALAGFSMAAVMVIFMGVFLGVDNENTTIYGNSSTNNNNGQFANNNTPTTQTNNTSNTRNTTFPPWGEKN